MSGLSISKFGDNLPVTSTIGLSQALAGFGAGLLVAGRIARPVRHKLGLGLAIAGLAALVPALIGIAANIGDRPHSSRRMRARLDSIRHDTGMSDNGY